MTREQAIRKREKLAAQLASATGVLRGSLLQRTIHHSLGRPFRRRMSRYPEVENTPPVLSKYQESVQ